MDNVLALIPARTGSKGIPNKNWRQFIDGSYPIGRAASCAWAAGVREVYLTTDLPTTSVFTFGDGVLVEVIHRPAALAADDTPMIAVVQHALAEIPGQPDQIILLVQCTQPLREPKHLQAAIALLQESGADSVVSVVELPLDLSPDVLCSIDGDQLAGWNNLIWAQPTRRQDARRAFKRDGTCYSFRRRTIEEYGSLYGLDCRPLIIPPEETCPLDTMDDWHEAERRLREKAARLAEA